jgi:hypothetical protein
LRLRHEKAAGLQRTTSLAHRTSRIQHSSQGGSRLCATFRVSGRPPERPDGLPAHPRPTPGSPWIAGTSDCSAAPRPRRIFGDVAAPAPSDPKRRSGPKPRGVQTPCASRTEARLRHHLSEPGLCAGARPNPTGKAGRREGCLAFRPGRRIARGNLERPGVRRRSIPKTLRRSAPVPVRGPSRSPICSARAKGRVTGPGSRLAEAKFAEGPTLSRAGS